MIKDQFTNLSTMNISPDISQPPVAAHANVLLPPLLIAGGIVAGVAVFLTVLNFFLQKFRREEPETLPAPAKLAGDDVKKVLSSIPVMCYTKNEPSLSQISYSECSVCLSAIEEGEKVRILPSCGHGFHAWCIDAWLQSRLTCPVCRSDVTAPQVCVTMPVVVVEGCGGAAAGAGKNEDNCSLPV